MCLTPEAVEPKSICRSFPKLFSCALSCLLCWVCMSRCWQQGVFGVAAVRRGHGQSHAGHSWSQIAPQHIHYSPWLNPSATCVAPLWKNKKWKGKMTHKQRTKGKECEEQQCEHQGERIITGRRCFRCWSRDCPAVCRGNHSQTMKKIWGGRSNQEELLWSGPSTLYLPVTTPFVVGRSLEWTSKTEPMRRWRRGLLLMSVLLFTIT